MLNRDTIVKGLTVLIIIIFSIAIVIVGSQTAKTYLTKATQGSSISNVSITSFASNKAEIAWQTNSKSQAVVTYGTNPNKLELFAFETEAKEGIHNLSLDLLSPNTTYYYKIKIGDKVFDNNGLPWSFTTASLSGPSPTPMSCNPEIFKNWLGTSNPLFDLNKDGIVNSRDYLICINQENLTPVP